MKTLHFKNQEFQAEIIIKGDDYIKGVNLEGFQVFLFDGISDFDYFTLSPDEDWDSPIEPEQINATNVKLNPIEGITVDTVHQGIEKLVTNIKKTVKTVNNIVPDEQGNVNIDGTDVSNIKPKDYSNYPMKNLCLFYSHPNRINGLNDNEKASEIYANYDIVVLSGEIVEHSSWAHEDAKIMVPMIKARNPNIEIFGYIHAHHEVNTPDFISYEKFEREVRTWRDTIGATGIFFDACGYDYKVSRERQIKLLSLIHDNGMNAVINCWNMEDIFSNKNIIRDGFAGNPNELPIKLGANDYYMFENHIYLSRDDDNEEGFKQQANNSTRVHKAIEYRYKPQEEFGGKSFYEHYKVKTLSLNGMTEPNHKYLMEAYLTALATGCHGFGMSGSNWGDSNYTHFDPPVELKGYTYDDFKIDKIFYKQSDSILNIKATIGRNVIDVIWNQSTTVKDATLFPNDTYIYQIDISSGVLNVDSSIEIYLNRKAYFPKLKLGDTPELVAQRIVAFDFGIEWKVTSAPMNNGSGGYSIYFEYHNGNPTYHLSGAWKDQNPSDFRGNYAYINSNKGLTFAFKVKSLFGKVERRVTLNDKFLSNDSGKSIFRPTRPKIGFSYIDTNLNKIVWWNGLNWIDAMGTIS